MCLLARSACEVVLFRAAEWSMGREVGRHSASNSPASGRKKRESYLAKPGFVWTYGQFSTLIFHTFGQVRTTGP